MWKNGLVSALSPQLLAYSLTEVTVTEETPNVPGSSSKQGYLDYPEVIE